MMGNLGVYTDENTVVIDVHNFNVLEAKCYLERVLAGIDTNRINEVIVIHGHNNGTRLKDMIYMGLKSKKILRKMACWNDGRTSLILKQ